VTIEEKSTGARDPLAAQLGGVEGEASVAAPENGALAGGPVNKDVGELACAIGDGEEMGFDAGASELGALVFGGRVGADFADVAGAESPGLAGHEGAGHLAARKEMGGEDFHFGVEGREAGQANEGVCGVEADAGDIDERQRVGHGRNVKE
jgi:hypothetical protein